MFIVYSKEYTEAYEELERIIKAEVYTFAHERGLNVYFLMDSKAVQESIALIASRVADLLETTHIDKDMVKFVKETKKLEKEEEMKKSKPRKPS